MWRTWNSNVKDNNNKDKDNNIPELLRRMTSERKRAKRYGEPANKT